MNKKVELELNRTIRMLIAHPENEPNSEFADRIDSLIDLREQLNLHIVNQRNELLFSFVKKYNSGNTHSRQEIKDFEVSDFLENYSG